MPKVSVIIPAYNRAEFIDAAIRSVLDQTFADFELLVVDDGSNDDTEEIVRRFQDERIKYIRHATNKGGSAARNTGIINSGGEYIAFLDSDDQWLPEKLEKQIALLDRSPPIVGGVYTGTLSVHKASGQIRRRRHPIKTGYIFPDMLTRNWVRSTTTVIVRKECFRKVGLFDENLTSAQDYDMWIRIAREYHFECIEEPLAKYYVHDNRISTNYGMKIKGLEGILKKHDSLFALDRKAYSRRYLALGTHYCYEGDLPKARKAFIKAIRAYPFEIRNYLCFLLSFAGAENFTKWTDLRKKIRLRNFMEYLRVSGGDHLR